MLNRETTLPILESAISTLKLYMSWDNSAFTRAQLLGLQGEKRVERHTARKDYMLIQYLRCLAVDLFDEEIDPEPASLPVITAMEMRNFFIEYLERMKREYDELHRLANEAVSAGLRPISKPLYELCSCLWDQIIECRRAIKEGDLARWEYHHISRYQVSYCNVHDMMISVEETDGWFY